MSKSEMIVNKYANALAELTLDQTTVDQLKLVNEVFIQNPQLISILSNPSVNPSSKKKILVELFANNISELVANTLCLLVDKRRMSLIPELYEEYLKVFLQRSNIALAQIHSASSIDATLLADISNRLEQMLNKSVELINHVDKDLIAGYKIKIENKVLDLSLKTKMREMQDLLA